MPMRWSARSLPARYRHGPRPLHGLVRLVGLDVALLLLMLLAFTPGGPDAGWSALGARLALAHEDPPRGATPTPPAKPGGMRGMEMGGAPTPVPAAQPGGMEMGGAPTPVLTAQPSGMSGGMEMGGSAPPAPVATPTGEKPMGAGQGSPLARDADEHAGDEAAAHGTATAAPDGGARNAILGGFAAVNGAVLVTAAILRKKSPRKGHPKPRAATPRATATDKGDTPA